jgi:hypothetical protein
MSPGQAQIHDQGRGATKQISGLPSDSFISICGLCAFRFAASALSLPSRFDFVGNADQIG